jgi:hypothetical protein
MNLSFLNLGKKKAGIKYRQGDSVSVALSCRYQHACTPIIID